MQEDSLSINR